MKFTKNESVKNYFWDQKTPRIIYYYMSKFLNYYRIINWYMHIETRVKADIPILQNSC